MVGARPSRGLAAAGRLDPQLGVVIVRHARDGDLDPMAPVIEQLRTIDGLVERKPGVFYRRSKAFLHFHVDGDDFYADVKLGGTGFERMKVTTKAEQRSLLTAVRRSVRS